MPTDRAGRVLVQPDLTIPGHPEVFVVGDAASLAGEDGRPLPGVAQVAMQQAAYATATILARASGRPPLAPFRYRDRGSMAIVGRGAAIADLGRLHLRGLPAWLAWLFIHLVMLIGFRSRLAVMFEWGIAFLTFQRSIRLITGGDRPPPAA